MHVSTVQISHDIHHATTTRFGARTFAPSKRTTPSAHNSQRQTPYPRLSRSAATAAGHHLCRTCRSVHSVCVSNVSPNLNYR